MAMSVLKVVYNLKFIYCYTEKDKNNLLNNGYSFIKEVKFEGRQAYLFINNGNKINFSNCEVKLTNKMYF